LKTVRTGEIKKKKVMEENLDTSCMSANQPKEGEILLKTGV
jgi:hypothetical protein